MLGSSMKATDFNPSIFDARGLADMKRLARGNDPAALKAAAQQFEALFLQMMLKSMRDATPQDGMFDSDQTRLYQSLLDQQMSQVLAAKGSTGLAKVIETQLSRDGSSSQEMLSPDLSSLGLPRMPVRPALADAGNAPAAIIPGASSASTTSAVPVDALPRTEAGSEFVQRMWPHALEASRATGIPARFLIAQAALETGWGRAEPKAANGQPSFNVFGIKAGSRWQGAVAEATTTEFAAGVAQQRVERFRAYGSYAEAFQDYARLISGNPRYAEVVGSQDPRAFSQGLARAGYATDPAYADKLARIIDGLGTTPAGA